MPRLDALSAYGWAGLAYLTLIQFCLAYLCWFAALQRLPASLAAAADDPAVDDLVRALHAEAMEAYGEDMGTPLVAIDGVCWFGPVIAELPEGDDAVALWDGLLALARVPGFYELKRRRTEGPSFD